MEDSNVQNILLNNPIIPWRSTIFLHKTKILLFIPNHLHITINYKLILSYEQ